MRRRLDSLGGLAVLAVLGGTLLAVLDGTPAGARPAAGPAPSTVTAALAPDQDPIAAGRQLYLQSCASCHGPAGQGGEGGPSLADSGAAAFDFYLRTGRMPLSGPDQPAYRQEVALSEAQIRALVAYGSSISTGPAIPTLVDQVPLQRGSQLYIQDCAACHGPGAAGGSIGGGSIAPALDRVDRARVAEAMLVGPGVMPVFAFPPEDLSAVGGYVEYLQHQPSPGGLDLSGTGPVPEGFIAGVIGLGLLVLVARWVGRTHHG